MTGDEMFPGTPAKAAHVVGEPGAARTYDPHRAARTTDPDTSHQAASQAATIVSLHHKEIRNALKRGPATPSGIAQRTTLDRVQIGRRLVELQRDGQIELTGATRPGDSGRNEREWRLT